MMVNNRNGLIRKLAWSFRRATWRQRGLPGCIIIGAQKSGTTSLFYFLSQHPQLLPPFYQEVHYFDGGLDPCIDTYQQGPAWYRASFPLKKQLNRGARTFEISPLYIFNPLVPARINETLPEVKLIALLRNPADRAISHYFHEKRKGRESLPILEAFEQEEERLKEVKARRDYKNRIFINYSYKSRGLYAEQLKKYYARFSPDQILVLKSEDLFSHTMETLREIFGFMGVEQNFKPKNVAPKNVGENKMAVNQKVLDYLNEYFAPHNKSLYDLLHRDFGW